MEQGEWNCLQFLDDILQHPYKRKNNYFNRDDATDDYEKAEEEEKDLEFEELGMTIEEVYEQSGLVYQTNPQEMVTLLKKVGLLCTTWAGRENGMGTSFTVTTESNARLPITWFRITKPWSFMDGSYIGLIYCILKKSSFFGA